MRKFIYKIFVFSISSFMVIGVLFVTTNNYIDRRASFKLQDSYENIIFGHSHPECAFNDSLILNFKNLSQSRQSYFYSYFKIKKVLSQNNKIKNCFIEFSNNQIATVMDSWIWDDLSINSRSLYLPFMKKEDLTILYKNNRNALITGFSKSFRNNLMNIVAMHLDYTKKIGGYIWNNKELRNYELSNKKVNKNDFKLSVTNIDYLKKIVEYCKYKNINIYFIRTPQHKNQYYRNNEIIFQKIRKERFNDITFLDFNNFPLSDNEFADFGHLNYKGAKRFSLWFNKIIKNGLLKCKDKQGFIDNEIKKVRTHNNVYKALGKR